MNTTHYPMNRRTRGRAAGFTLLEIIIVVGLIAALSGALIVGLQGTGNAGQKQIEKQFVTTGVKAPLMAYRLNIGDYPSSDQGLGALIIAPSGVGSKWSGPYLDSAAVDSWGQPYNYRYPGTNNKTFPDIWSNGPDRQNNEGGGDDVNNWDH
ncbi:type II secretion system major pseudopilin GspG [Cerasicoccus arenae]|uniref:Type II secretion system protein GspG n=1 Tax=Cerasicoccus arenae TaxID=424488 RepID=A0A8J3DB36_9BACT|nr:type II secretion system major pseudopilin GspG [Cerasicoccus arenae]MBK1857971.1 type II secretion system major pseudopilin GspG [Cerasicoccus arenae]GHB97749.1 type II secretion system protein GspG [Cerasicoccus arenae]